MEKVRELFRAFMVKIFETALDFIHYAHLREDIEWALERAVYDKSNRDAEYFKRSIEGG